MLSARAVKLLKYFTDHKPHKITIEDDAFLELVKAELLDYERGQGWVITEAGLKYLESNS